MATARLQQTMSEQKFTFQELYQTRFLDASRRQNLELELNTGEAIDKNFANSLERVIGKLHPNGNVYDVYYPIVISYSTKNREQMDPPHTGPGYVIVACLIRYLFDNKMPCYSDIMTRAGQTWAEDYDVHVRGAKVLMAMLSQRFFSSVHCLREVALAVRSHTKVIPVRMEEYSARGWDIISDDENMWSEENLESYATIQEDPDAAMRELRRMRDDAKGALRGTRTIPPHGTILSDPEALGDLLSELEKATQPCPRDTYRVIPADSVQVILKSRLKCSKETIHILDTWTPPLARFSKAIIEGVRGGAKARFLLLDPWSGLTRKRTEAIASSPSKRIVPEQDARVGIAENLRIIQSMKDQLPERQRSAVEVRLYNSLPSLPLYRTDGKYLSGTFLHGRMAVECPHLDVEEASTLGKSYSEEFQIVWELARPFDPKDWRNALSSFLDLKSRL